MESALEIEDSNEHDRPAQAWFFQTCVRPHDDKTFSYLLETRKKQLDTSLATARVITWAFSDTAGLKSQILKLSLFL